MSPPKKIKYKMLSLKNYPLLSYATFTGIIMKILKSIGQTNIPKLTTRAIFYGWTYGRTDLPQI